MITKTVFKTREEWLADRNEKPVIGGSNIGIILELSEWTSPYEYWLSLQEEVKVPEIEEKRLSRGNFMEDGIAKWFEQQTGEKIIKNSSRIVVYHNDEYPDYFQVAPDRELFQKGRETRPVLEIKDLKKYLDVLDLTTISPENYAQLQYQMGYLERESGYLAVNDGNKELHYFLFSFDKEYYDKMIVQASAWWEKHVIGGIAPEPTTGRDVQLMYPDSNAVVKPATEDVFEAAGKIKRIKEEIKTKESELEEYMDFIKTRFGDADTLELDGIRFATFKTQTKGGIDIARLKKEYPKIAEELSTESKFRVLRIK